MCKLNFSSVTYVTFSGSHTRVAILFDDCYLKFFVIAISRKKPLTKVTKTFWLTV